MDRMIYLSMTGAKALMERQDALSHNLANASTDGFRADLMTARAVPIREEGTATTRVFNVETSTGFDGKSGPIRQIGNPLDLVIRDNGWLQNAVYIRLLTPLGSWWAEDSRLAAAPVAA